MFDHRVLIHIISLFRLGQCINKTPVGHFQAHIAFPGNNGTYRHIPFFFSQINMFLRFRAHAGRIRTGFTGTRRSINRNGLLRLAVRIPVTDSATRAVQVDGFACNRLVTGIICLGNVAIGPQAHFGRLAAALRCLAAALQSFDHHVARQALAFCQAALNIYVNTAAVGRNSLKPYPVTGGIAFFTVRACCGNKLTQGNDMDILNIVFCL